MAGTILLIDDEEGLRKMLCRIVSLEGFTVIEAIDLAHARKCLKQATVDIVLCDVRLPDGNGVDFITEAKEAAPSCEVILLTAYGNIPDGVQAIKKGAFDYLVKGNDNSRIIPLLFQAYEKVRKRKADAVKVSSAGSLVNNEIIGQSHSINEAKRMAEKIATSDATVLLLGETGTGKEVFANFIHRLSPRSQSSFVAINCSAFTRELLESELFGHKAGSFTGATKDKKGLFEVADGGTLFLDEIGELDPDLQAKLLRVLENGAFIKLGDTKVTKVNVRIIAATNRDLVREMKEGRFRSDLYYRINVFSIPLPSLRERPEDISLLVRHFLDLYQQKENKDAITVRKDAMKLLTDYSWPGNIRELRNVLQRAVILLDDHEILPSHLPFELQKAIASNSHLSLAEVERSHILKVLEHVKGNKTKAAELLNIGLSTLYRKMDEYGIAGQRY